jgi:hypothetical protein
MASSELGRPGQCAESAIRWASWPNVLPCLGEAQQTRRTDSQGDGQMGAKEWQELEVEKVALLEPALSAGLDVISGNGLHVDQHGLGRTSKGTTR